MPSRLVAPLLLAGTVSMIGGAALAEPPLWVIEEEDATVYMVGTIHLMRDGAAWRTEAFDAAFEAADVVWLELAGAGDPEAMVPDIMERALSPEASLSERLEADDFALLEDALETYGVPIEAINHVQPWFAALQLTTIPLVEAGFDPANSLDLLIEAEAEDAGKRILAFETVEEQIETLAGMSEEAQIEMLRQTLLDIRNSGDAMVEQVDAWADGDLDALAESIEQAYVTAPEFHDRLFTQRNIGFADQIEEIVADGGTALVAVGLGHFVGEGSIPELLEARGYEVELR
ncbi:TraB/GumN family protein [Pelagibacterium montanilacus]|uniref:TraB/GumN family protein n=1 Tax=Pelagibacterium montanilacus TaxID=2185280 RepID=UPI0013E09C29|nr:TraB/GumN family protein [Pelagibacterium montanilacus]